MNMQKQGEILVHVEKLKKEFPLTSPTIWQRTPKVVHAIDGLTFDIYKGETFAVVGESGCGKTTLARSILQTCKPSSGKVFFDNQELTRLKPNELRPLRPRMQMIFQNPYNSLNPRFTVGQIIAEGLLIQNKLHGEALENKIESLMGQVGLNPILRSRYPHEFSSGQRQRIGIARAISLNPELIICDEPVSALDASIQAQMINLLMHLQKQLNLTYLYISHDLSIVQYISDRVAVMYMGKFVELGKTEIVFSTPLHPYTQALRSTIALPEHFGNKTVAKIAIIGDKPFAGTPSSGCHFFQQCPIAMERCANEEPEFQKMGGDHYVACHRI
jgi:oligopeptide transport system ATP-binding protein